MNAKGDANRSVRMTKQRLYQALITLLQQKSLREITVSGNLLNWPGSAAGRSISTMPISMP